MGNLRPFKLFNTALLKPLKCAFFIEKSTKNVEKTCTLALDKAGKKHNISHFQQHIFLMLRQCLQNFLMVCPWVGVLVKLMD
jgi:hypothetical protein